MSVTAKPLQGAKVLVAEDEAILALDLVQTLSKAGANIIAPAKTVERAVELAQKEDLDCSILDVRLKDGLVFPAAEERRFSEYHHSRR